MFSLLFVLGVRLVLVGWHACSGLSVFLSLYYLYLVFLVRFLLPGLKKF